MKRAVEEILKFNEERDWDQFHNPENLAKSGTMSRKRTHKIDKF